MVAAVLGKLSGSSAFWFAQCGFDYIRRVLSESVGRRAEGWMDGWVRAKVKSEQKDLKAALGTDKVTTFHHVTANVKEKRCN